MREASQSIVSLPETLELTLLWILASSGFATGMPGGQGVIGSSITTGHNTLGGHNSEFFLRRTFAGDLSGSSVAYFQLTTLTL